MSERLPLGWILDQKVLGDGTVKKFYHNLATGQRFETKEDLARYENYRQNIHPHFEAFNRAYAVNGNYVERPWETDTEYNLHDYMQGRVGKLKDKEINPVIEVNEMPAKEKKGNGKGKEKKKWSKR